MIPLYVFLGGGIGSVLRFFVQNYFGSSRGTLLVNLLGSFLVGFVVQKLGARDEIRTFVTVGILGGFTTFSAFSFESLKIGDPLRGFVYVSVSVVGSLLLCALGTYLAR